jgi:hypothetical protein
MKHCYSNFPILIDEKKYSKTRNEVYEELKSTLFSEGGISIH